jgi:hypothetical protein
MVRASTGYTYARLLLVYQAFNLFRVGSASLEVKILIPVSWCLVALQLGALYVWGRRLCHTKFVYAAGSIGNAEWTGVELRGVLFRAGVPQGSRCC